MYREKINQQEEDKMALSENQIQESEIKDRIWETVDNFDQEKDNKELEEIWRAKYKGDAQSFFNDDNLESLAALTGGQRLNLLADVASSIFATPQLVEKYYQKFPEDLQAVDKIFRINRHNLDMKKYHLFSLSALSMDQSGLQVVECPDRYNYMMGDLEQFYGIARRRQEAPKFLLSNFKDIPMAEDFAEFGAAKEGLFKTLSQASDYEYTARYSLNTDKMFSGAFEELSEENKARFLHKCLAHFQYFLLFNETYNSRFSPESAAYEEKQSKSDHRPWGYNVAHSMIYKTYQPGKAYELSQDFFNHDMSSTAAGGGDVEEYADHKMLLATLDRLKDVMADKDETTRLVVELWNKNRNPIFANVIAEVLSKQNVNLAAAQLLELLHSEKDKKEPLAAMLYRLEFGRIGVSQEGIKYLEKIYDLGEYNNPGYHASRLTADGEVGVFNEELELIKYFHLGRLDTEEKKVKAKVMDFTYDTLFIGRPDESAEERKSREAYLAEFKKNYYKISEDQVFQATGARLNNLSFKEQGWFLIYYNQATSDEQKKLQDFVADFKEDGIKSFLSLEIDQGLGSKIIDLGHKVDRDSARLIFQRIAEIVSLVEKENNELNKLFLLGQGEDKFDWRAVRLTLLQKTKKIITDFHSDPPALAEPEAVAELLKDLERSHSEVSLLAAVLKEAKQAGQKINFEKIKDLRLEKKIINPTNNLSVAEREELKEISAENYKRIFLSDPAATNQAAYERVTAEFAKEVESLNGQLVYLLKYQNRIISFIRFKPLSGTEVYGGSLNVAQEVQGLSIGNHFMNSTIAEVAKSYNIRVKSRKDNPANDNYQRRGFVIVDEHREADGIEYYDMVKPSDKESQKAA
ncbi:MAG: GNAT family N-acetyltransferase [Patescibacteria group bacterium]